MKSPMHEQVKIKEELIQVLKKKDIESTNENKRSSQFGDINVNINPLDVVNPLENETPTSDPQKLIKLAEQFTDVRDKLIFMSKINSKLLGKHTKSC